MYDDSSAIVSNTPFASPLTSKVKESRRPVLPTSFKGRYIFYAAFLLPIKLENLGSKTRG